MRGEGGKGGAMYGVYDSGVERGGEGKGNLREREKRERFGGSI